MFRAITDSTSTIFLESLPNIISPIHVHFLQHRFSSSIKTEKPPRLLGYPTFGLTYMAKNFQSCGKK